MLRKHLTILALAAALCLALTAAAEPVDLNGMSFEELLALRDAVERALWDSPEWATVEMPAGLYHVGEDIPAGRYEIRLADADAPGYAFIGRLNDTGTKVDTTPGSGYQRYYLDDSERIIWALADGAYIQAETAVTLQRPGGLVFAVADQEQDTGAEMMDYVLNNGTRKFHKPGCASVGKIAEGNREDYRGTREALIAMGYAPCGQCNP